MHVVRRSRPGAGRAGAGRARPARPRARSRAGGRLARRTGATWLRRRLLLVVSVSLADGLLCDVVAYERDTTVFYFPLMAGSASNCTRACCRCGRRRSSAAIRSLPTARSAWPIRPRCWRCCCCPPSEPSCCCACCTCGSRRSARLPWRAAGGCRAPRAVLAGLVFALGNFLQAQIHHENIVRTAAGYRSCWRWSSRPAQRRLARASCAGRCSPRARWGWPGWACTRRCWPSTCWSWPATAPSAGQSARSAQPARWRPARGDRARGGRLRVHRRPVWSPRRRAAVQLAEHERDLPLDTEPGASPCSAPRAATRASTSAATTSPAPMASPSRPTAC